MHPSVISIPLSFLVATATATSPASSASSPASTSPSSTKPTSSITYGGGDGSTCEQAIVIQGAKGEPDGVASEYAWLKSHFPGYKMSRQAEINNSGKMFDQLDFADRDGKPHSICFDITAYYGKF